MSEDVKVVSVTGVAAQSMGGYEGERKKRVRATTRKRKGGAEEGPVIQVDTAQSMPPMTPMTPMPPMPPMPPPHMQPPPMPYQMQQQMPQQMPQQATMRGPQDMDELMRHLHADPGAERFEVMSVTDSDISSILDTTVDGAARRRSRSSGKAKRTLNL